MKTDIYLVRHGQTLFNQLGLTQGFCDSPLTSLGIKQAKTTGDYFKQAGIQFDAAYCSTLERTEDTLLNMYTGPYERLKDLKEWFFGTFEGAPSYLEPKHKPGQVSHEDNFVSYGGEGVSEVQARMTNALIKIGEENKGKTAIAVSHAGSLYAFFLQWQKVGDVKPKFSNCGILHYIYEDGDFTLVESMDPALAVKG